MILISFFLFLFPTSIDFDVPNQIVIWNVGQGQWITTIDQNHCYHFDVGGEFFNYSKVSKACAQKDNFIFLSHWDWDHIGLLGKIKNFKSICIAVSPQGDAKDYKKLFLNKIPHCQNKKFSYVQQLKFPYKNIKKDNDLSNIFIYQKKLLIPGDSPRKMEEVWSSQIRGKKLKWLFVSHHGSKTSTSEKFLKNNSTFDLAFISARKKVYGHPHPSVLKRLKKYNIPVLETEIWGNIRILTH